MTKGLIEMKVNECVRGAVRQGTDYTGDILQEESSLQSWLLQFS